MDHGASEPLLASQILAYKRPDAEVVAALGSDAERGLTPVEAEARLVRHGPNVLAEQTGLPGWRIFLGHFNNILVLLLLVAAAISGGLWLWERETDLPYEALSIFAIVVLNAAMGHWQQARAEQAVAALQQISAARARVVRDGAVQMVAAARLVPGDIVLVEEGDIVPADARILRSATLQVNEAALTGESMPVAKQNTAIGPDVPTGDQLNMIFSGTTVTYGHARAVVTETGMETRIGRIAGLLERVTIEVTPLQHDLNRLGRVLAVVVSGLAAVIMAALLLTEGITTLTAAADILILGVALAVAAVPEGLPAIVTVVLALGVQRMAARRAIVRHLAAVEALGAADVIVSDKTGTLTRNEITVRRIVTASGGVVLEGTGYTPEGAVRSDTGGDIAGPLRYEATLALAAADRANNAVLETRRGRWTVQGDPLEGALIVAARKAGLERDTLDARFGRVAEVPFSSERKLMSTLHTDTEQAEHLLTFTKGAPDVLLTRCTREQVGEDARPLTDERRAQILAVNEALASEALRTLAVAARRLPRAGFDFETCDERIEHELVFLGLFGMIDPPREEAREAVAAARAAGIRPVMMTGDHPRTAVVIAEELGISTDGRVVTGCELERMDDAAVDRLAQSVSVYARVDPEHKLRVVQSLQRQGKTVAMTGDGINDAPALRIADIGIAMGVTGTDVSRQAADMILADDNFATIVAAVDEGRAIFANIRKFLRYLLSSNFGEVATMFFGLLLADVIGLSAQSNGLALPLLATQILWINLVTDGAPALALGLEPAEPGLMRRPPRPRREGIMIGPMWAGIAFVGIIMAAGTLLVLDASLPGGLIEGHGTLTYAQTMAFTTLTMFQLFNLLNARSDEESAFRGLARSPWLWTAVALSLLLHLAVIYLPPLQVAFSTVSLSLADWLRCVLIASSVLWLRELSKVYAALRR